MTNVVLPALSMRMKALGANLPVGRSGGCSGSFAARTGKMESEQKPARQPAGQHDRDANSLGSVF